MMDNPGAFFGGHPLYSIGRAAEREVPKVIAPLPFGSHPSPEAQAAFLHPEVL